MSSSEAGSRESFPLIIERPSEDVAIEICNAFDQIVAAPTPAHRSSKIQDTSRGQQIRIQVPRGLYFVRSSLGGESQERVVRVSGETKVEAAVPIRSTSAAYQGVESSHEYYSYPAAEQSRQPTTRVLEAGPMADSWLFLFVRARDKEAYAAAGGGLEPAASGWHLETPQGQAIPLAARTFEHRGTSSCKYFTVGMGCASSLKCQVRRVVAASCERPPRQRPVSRQGGVGKAVRPVWGEGRWTTAAGCALARRL